MGWESIPRGQNESLLRPAAALAPRFPCRPLALTRNLEGQAVGLGSRVECSADGQVWEGDGGRKAVAEGNMRGLLRDAIASLSGPWGPWTGVSPSNC